MRTLVVVSILSLAIGCKGKPRSKTAPNKVETAEGSKPAVPRDVDLPQGPGTPPPKSTKPLDDATAQKMADMTFDGFVKDVRTASQKGVWILQQIPSHPILRASIHINPCGGEWPCWPIDLATWQGHKEELKGYLTDDLKAAPDTQFEIGQIDLHGEKMIYTYQLAQVVGNGHSAHSHCYVLYYNDGINTIRVLSEYKDDMLKTKEDMARVLPRTDLENTAKAFMDVYTQKFN